MQWELERELLSACEKGDLDTVRRLSGEVAVSHVRDRRGWRPLHFAARSVDNYTSGKNHFHEMNGDVGMAGWK